MDVYDRKVQKKKTSGFFVAVPAPIAYALGIEKGTTVRFWSLNGKAAFKPIELDGPTEKDVADVEGREEAADPGPDQGRGQTRPRACGRCPDCGERRPGVQEPCRMPEAKSDVPWWACF